MPNQSKTRNWLLITAFLCMAAGNGAMLWNTRVEMRRGSGDFSSFYTAGTLVRRGQGAEIYNSVSQWKVQQEFAAEVKMRRGPLRYMRPPFEALLFSMLAAWPYPTALLAWTGVKLVLLAAIPFIVVPGRFWKEPFPRWTTIFLLLGTFPEFIDLLMGQDAPLLAFLFAISFWQLATHRETGAGFTLGLALFKFQLVVPFVLVLLIAGRKRILPGFATTAVVLLAVSAAIVGWKGLLDYPSYLQNLNQAAGVGIAVENQMNLRGLLTFFFGLKGFSRLLYWVLAPIALGAIVYAGTIWRRAGDRWLAEGFGLAAIVAIVTSYYANDYDLLLLIVPLLAVRAYRDNALILDRATRYLETAGLLLLLLSPLYWFARMKLKAESVMILPLLAVGVALARRLNRDDHGEEEQTAPLLQGPA